MTSFTVITQNQLEIISLIQAELISRLKNGRIGNNSSELMPYMSLIEKALPLLPAMPLEVAEQLAASDSEKLLSLMSLILEGDSMPIDQSRFDAALAKINDLKSDAADDQANKEALSKAQAELSKAQESLGSMQAKVDQLSADDEADKAAIAQAKADLQSAEAAVKSAEDKANTLIDQILPVSEAAVPAQPEVPVSNDIPPLM